MDTPPLDPQPVPTPTSSPLERFLRALRIVAITAFVCWHLFYLLFRNPLDLWWNEIVTGWLKKQVWWDRPLVTMQQNFPNDPRHVVVTPGKIFSTIDMATDRYGHFFGVEQGWSMFTPPIARKAPFLAAEIELNDDSREVLLSPNEVSLPEGWYFRWDGWRQRKLEDYMIYENTDSIPGKSDPQIFQAYVRWAVRRWRAQHPDDPREVVRVRLLKRNWSLPGPDESRTAHQVKVTEIGTFTPDGAFQP